MRDKSAQASRTTAKRLTHRSKVVPQSAHFLMKLDDVRSSVGLSIDSPPTDSTDPLATTSARSQFEVIPPLDSNDSVPSTTACCEFNATDMSPRGSTKSLPTMTVRSQLAAILGRSSTDPLATTARFELEVIDVPPPNLTDSLAPRILRLESVEAAFSTGMRGRPLRDAAVKAAPREQAEENPNQLSLSPLRATTAPHLD